MFEDTRGVFKSRILKDRKYNGQKKNDKRTNNDLQSTTQKTKYWATETSQKLGVKSGVLLGKLVHVSLVAPIVLIFLPKWRIVPVMTIAEILLGNYKLDIKQQSISQSSCWFPREPCVYKYDIVSLKQISAGLCNESKTYITLLLDYWYPINLIFHCLVQFLFLCIEDWNSEWLLFNVK